MSERAAQETYALLDLDGDGTADRITLRSRMAQALNTPDHSPLDQYVFTVNTTSGEMRTAQNLGNSIYAFSPDGRQILLALTRKDEQGQYESFLFRYRNGELQEVGSFAQDIRKIWVQNGQITTGRNSDDIIFAEPNMTGANTIQDSRNSDGTPSRAYVETLQEKISADMVAGKLPFVVTSVIRENPLRLEVELTEMTDENIKIIRSYETNGSAITFAQSSGNVQELQHNNDSQSQIAPQISKEDENKAFDFKSFSTPVINTLAQLGVKAEFTGRNDLEIDGKKFCGNAQAYINGRIMHHGCLLFDVDLSVLANALKVSKDKFESKGVKSVRARVTNIIDELPEKITVEEFRDLLLDYMKKEYPEMTEYVFSDEELAEINRIKETKFGTWDWNYGKSPEYNVRRGTKIPKR